MSLFDQQPMGPVPARRPVMNPPDPAREGLPYPEAMDVHVEQPVPSELEDEDSGDTQTSNRHWFRFTVASILIVAFVISVVGGAFALFHPSENTLIGIAGMTVAVVVTVVIVAVRVWSRWRDRNL